MIKNSKNTLGYLGQAFQLKFIGQLLSDSRYANSVMDIVKPEYFDDEKVRCIIMYIKDNYEQYDSIPDFVGAEILLRNQISGHQLEHCLALLAKAKEYGFNNSLQIQDVAKTFFKQQEMIKASREVLRIAEGGNTDKYHECEDLLKRALEFGNNKDEVIDVFEDIDSVLSDDFRKPIPTGIVGLDINMGGGLSKGELGVILAPFGVGKSQPLSSKILTPSGWITMGDVKVGGYVISRNGKPTKVIGVYPQGVRPIYKVSFNNNTKVLCDEEHLWSVNTIQQRNRKFNPDNSFKTIKTIDMVNNVRVWGNKRLNYMIPNLEPVEFNYSKLPIDPYVFGLSLVKNDSNEIIPENYLINSIENRVSLLQGLVDSNSHVSNYRILIKTSSFLFANQIKELVMSLGGTCNIIDKINSDKNINKSTYNISFNFPETITFKPSRLRDKLDLLKPLSKNSNNKMITSIEYSHDEMAQCIMVDNPEHLYVTDDYIVTHNTTMVTKIANTAKNHGYNVLQIFFEDNPKVIQRKHYTCWTGISLNDLQDRRIEVKEILSQELSKPGKIKLKKFPSDGTTIPMIRQYIRKQISQGFRPDIVLLDYIDCISPSKIVSDNNIAEGNIMRQFESMLDELHVAGWTAIQGNRQSIGADVVDSNQIGGSIKKGQIGHFIVSIAKTLAQKEDGSANIAILKSRFGKDGIIFRNCVFDNGLVKIETDDEDCGASFTDMSKIKKHEDDNALALAMAAVKLRKEKLDNNGELNL